MNIYVGNLNYRVREDDLKQVIVEMPDDEAAKKAIAELNEAEYEGRQIVIKEARPK